MNFVEEEIFCQVPTPFLFKLYRFFIGSTKYFFFDQKKIVYFFEYQLT